jgi:hypothetical protein
MAVVQYLANKRQAAEENLGGKKEQGAQGKALSAHRSGGAAALFLPQSQGVIRLNLTEKSKGLRLNVRSLQKFQMKNLWFLMSFISLKLKLSKWLKLWKILNLTRRLSFWTNQIKTLCYQQETYRMS